jgi:hypothetical protein
MPSKNQTDPDRAIVRASDVGLYAYCARAWWLGRVEGYRPVNQAALEAGETAHQAHGGVVAGYDLLQRAAYGLLGLAFLAAIVLLIVVLIR